MEINKYTGTGTMNLESISSPKDKIELTNKYNCEEIMSGKRKFSSVSPLQKCLNYNELDVK